MRESSEAVVEMRNLSRRFGDKKALDDIFVARAGARIAEHAEA